MKKIITAVIILTSLTLILTFARVFLARGLSGLLASFQTTKELESPAYIKRIISQTGQYDWQVKTAYFEGKKIPLPENLAVLPLDQDVLGLQVWAAEGDKWIEVDLTNQKLYAKEGGNIVYEFPISSGMPWTPTVTGEFRIWSKLKYTRMAGGCQIGDCYDLPNVPYTQYFHGGYALHGAYWHNDFGRPRSHGCVNLPIPAAEKLYYWTFPPVNENSTVTYPNNEIPGTRVIVYGQAHL